MAWLKKLFSLLRVNHWSKSIFVLLGVLYADTPGYWLEALLAAFCFCLIASAVYIYNDLQDIEEDRLHPHKQNRPLASMEVSAGFAITVLVVLLLTGLILAFTVSTTLTALLGIYLLINLLYNHWFRNIPIIDVICITLGFILRILAGTVGIGLPITWWLAITATLLSFLIALCKRRLEMQLGLAEVSRAVLARYHPPLLDFLINITAMGTFLAYLSYVLYTHHHSFYFLLTIPFAAFGLWRFLMLITVEKNVDDPVFIFFHDTLSRLNLLFFFMLTVAGLLSE
ncbi:MULTISPECIES: decaprenyl-phosphate phosphoribosyltransferase [Legionella]|uniref:Decaprenyl-phosphate phosphoribosyltransferase n=1 Tax=Legionella septentrionalis TaxID=2498109 RepID=A0A433JJG5_9GAMM|nr:MULTISPECIES: decaprenyl-phosphate phosphoribosyltransferase [Legionella]MCP0913575.1 decaprenyl-phosphate phosphoribosyltransferase [Legionella sp. 27cVA30]RUQ88236.1 decaprenyl-phosphate phosphoribosyltransferase [Legionella septentrionalis]RUQ97478.1 decaprenyl-phosphate phosphoribosyltransferase [Legionella septentrionalis]RUR09774.1 decaprenyl-phosphate phosphoribosyltransferase [Legionella septentrionalis]RUR15934.1 decaprenyl-phosphate phosphoribosyltransferase [Legionella septentrio